jgi:hypothetical protein
MQSKTTVNTTYVLVTSVTNISGVEITNSFAPETFYSVKQATDYWLENYKNRNKGDGNDEYWNKIPLRIQKTIKIVENIW